jgi:predicted anti-sigma-YlaC factor YlaD
VTLRGPEALACNEVVEMVSEYLDGAMSPMDRARLEQHLLVCPGCTAHVGQMRSTISQVAKLRTNATAIGPALVGLFREWKRKQGE